MTAPETIEIQPVAGPVEARMRPPGSKSLTNRALVCAALADGESTLTGALVSDDTHVMIDGLSRLGVPIDVSDDGTTLQVAGAGGVIPAIEADLFIGNSGTTVRFLTALATLGHGAFRLDGVARMRERPLGDLADALNALGALVETAGCRRRILLAHFGEHPPETCGNCDNCLSPPAAIDATETARKYLSAVFRTGQSFGATYIEEVLTGKSSERSLMNGHEALGVWNIVDGEEVTLLKPVGRALLLRDALRANEHGGLEFGPGARGLLKGEDMLSLVVPPKRERRRRGDTVQNPIGDPLFEALRARRREIAQEAGMPPYVIFHDSVLREMATVRPATLAAMGRLTGVGQRKLDAYGDAFLRVIREN